MIFNQAITVMYQTIHVESCKSN